MSKKDSGKKLNSDGWLNGAFSLTAPSSLAKSIVCIDDCNNCPLYKKGCAGNCIRWDEKVCNYCPCLGSKYVGEDGTEPITVDPTTGKKKEVDIELLKIRVIRKKLLDGMPVNMVI